MFDDLVRPRFARLAAPTSRALARWRIAPSHVTVGGFILALAAAVAIATAHPWLGLGFWLASRVADGLDGLLARDAGQQSAFGGYLDITLDMAAYSAVVVGFAILYPAHHMLWTVVLAGYVLNITTTLALAAAAAGCARAVAVGDRSFQFTRGLVEAGETSLVYVLWALFPEAVAVVGWTWCVLLVLTAAQRTWIAHRALRAVGDR